MEISANHNPHNLKRQQHDIRQLHPFSPAFQTLLT